MFHSYFERKSEKVSTFHIVHFPNPEISSSLKLASNLRASKFDKHDREALQRAN